MKEIIDSAKTQLETGNFLKHIDEDYGQLDFVNPPVKWPCALISINTGVFDNLGMDKSLTPKNRQMGDFTVDFRVAVLKLSPGNVKATNQQKENNLRIFDVLQDVHNLIQGWSPGGKVGKFIRTKIRNEKRDDGIQEYVVSYRVELHNC